MFGEGSETCVPVSGKAKRPAVRPSVDCPTYGHESGERQGRALPGFPLGQIWKSGRATRQSALPSRTDIISRAYQVRKPSHQQTCSSTTPRAPEIKPMPVDQRPKDRLPAITQPLTAGTGLRTLLAVWKL